MRGFVKGVVVGVALGYFFQDEIGETLDRVFPDKTNEAAYGGSPVTVPTPDETESSIRNLATGAALPSHRIDEINAATPEDPVVLDDHEIEILATHNMNRLRIALGAKRLLIKGVTA